MVKSDTASFSIPELEFEVPANTQKGGNVCTVHIFPFVVVTCILVVISTVEGILERTITGLDQGQVVRRVS